MYQKLGSPISRHAPRISPSALRLQIGTIFLLSSGPTMSAMGPRGSAKLPSHRQRRAPGRKKEGERERGRGDAPGREEDDVRRELAAVGELEARRREALDLRPVLELDLAVDNELAGPNIWKKYSYVRSSRKTKNIPR